jgi:hypothetical protein
MTEKIFFGDNVSPITCHAWNKDRSRKYIDAYNKTSVIKAEMTHLFF